MSSLQTYQGVQANLSRQLSGGGGNHRFPLTTVDHHRRATFTNA